VHFLNLRLEINLSAGSQNQFRSSVATVLHAQIQASNAFLQFMVSIYILHKCLLSAAIYDQLP